MGRWAGLTSVVLLAACGATPAAPPTPPVDPNLQVTPNGSTGPVRITFVSANVAPGSTVTGCGPLIEGCKGRVRMTVQLNPPSDGPVLYVRIYLFAANQLACLWGQTDPFTVSAGAPLNVDVTMDTSDQCVTPTTIANMACVVEGTVQVASRQTWSLHYVFAP
jgi:hypothetical protein